MHADGVETPHMSTSATFVPNAIAIVHGRACGIVGNPGHASSWDGNSADGKPFLLIRTKEKHDFMKTSSMVPGGHMHVESMRECNCGAATNSSKPSALVCRGHNVSYIAHANAS